MPGESGATAVNTRVHTHYQYAHTRLRVHRAPGIPHALCSRGPKFLQISGASRREKADLCFDVIACDKREAFAQGSETTKQSILSLLGTMDCFACARNDDL
jgi:hypothetical protein